MTNLRAATLAIVSLLLGGSLLGYTLLNLSPYAVGTALNPTAIMLFFAGLFLLVAGLASLCALALHRRWPALAGKDARRHGSQRAPSRSARRASRNAAAALRQGILCGLAVAILSALAMLNHFDITLALITLLLAGLIEAFAQTR